MVSGTRRQSIGKQEVRECVRQKGCGWVSRRIFSGKQVEVVEGFFCRVREFIPIRVEKESNTARHVGCPADARVGGVADGLREAGAILGGNKLGKYGHLVRALVEACLFTGEYVVGRGGWSGLKEEERGQPRTSKISRRGGVGGQKGNRDLTDDVEAACAAAVSHCWCQPVGKRSTAGEVHWGAPPNL